MALTKVSYDMIRGAPVNVADFIPQTVTSNYEPYIQSAIDYCVLNEKDLYIDKIYPITQQLVINRGLVDQAGNPIDTYDYTIMTIFADGGGFSINSDIAGIFKCTFAYVSTPYRPTTQNIRFLNLRFIADLGTRNAWVIQGGTSSTPTFLRTTFEHCQFEKIKLVADTYFSYLQSWYLINCLATAWVGNFMKADRAFDIQVIGGRYEGTVNGNCFILTNIHGSKMWTQIESVSQTAIGTNASYGLDISCYFEANGRDVDTAIPLNPQLAIDLGTIFNRGIHIHGSLFSSATVGFPRVNWNENSRGCSSLGNVATAASNAYIHSFNGTNFSALQTVEINDVVDGAGTVSSFDAYANSGNRRSTTAPAGFSVSAISNTSFFATSNVTFIYNKSGGFVNMNFIATITATVDTIANILIIENFGYAPFSPANTYLVGTVTVDTTSYPLAVASDGSFRTLVNALPITLTGASYTVRAFINYPTVLL